VKLIRKWALSIRRRSKDFLFDGDDLAFKAAATGAQVYAEYGVGKSSVWMLRNTAAQIIAVDTSEHWINRVKDQIADAGRFDVEWVNLGPLGWAGRPISYRHRHLFQQYVNSVWERHLSPDLVLIDGRCRVACFLTSLARAKPGCRIFFDDYTDRPQYHLVEEYLNPAGFCGRQAEFLVPDDVDRATVLAEANRFIYVLD